MRLNTIAACVLACAFTTLASAQAAPSSADKGTSYSHAQLKQMERDARTPEQNKALADYYGKKQKDYAQLAADAKQDWLQKSQNAPAVAAAKYPRPVDSARNLFEYYTQKASDAATLSAKYDQLASTYLTAKNK
jgi:uncharacterized membrane protein YccC